MVVFRDNLANMVVNGRFYSNFRAQISEHTVSDGREDASHGCQVQVILLCCEIKREAESCSCATVLSGMSEGISTLLSSVLSHRI